MEVASEKQSPDRQRKVIVTAFVVVFLLIAVILCAGGIGAVYIQKLQARIESLEKLCGSGKYHAADKREVLSSSTSNLQSLLLIHLQTTLSTVQQKYQEGDADLQREISAQAAELRREMKSGSSQVQQQLGDVRQQFRTELGAVDKRIETLNDEMTQLHPSAKGTHDNVNIYSHKDSRSADVTCATGYKLNPYRDTCIRFVRESLSWFDAKATCEKSGEFLATFDTVESASWVRHQQLTAGWTENVWIGARKLSNSPEFRWYGINTGLLSIGYWAATQPDNPSYELCVATLGGGHYYWNDLSCSGKTYFLCEQRAK